MEAQDTAEERSGDGAVAPGTAENHALAAPISGSLSRENSLSGGGLWAGRTHSRRGRKQPDRRLHADLLDAVFASRRDRGASFDAYVRYRDAGCRARDLGVAFALALPVIREVCTVRDRGLVGSAASAIWRALRERRFVEGGVRAYWAYLRRTARGTIVNQRAADDRFRLVDRIPPGVCADEIGTGRLIEVADVEQKLVLDKIPLLIIDQVVPRVRFKGEEREACLYILLAILERRELSARGLGDQFDLPVERFQFLVDYVVVRVRLALSRIKGELKAAMANEPRWRGSQSVNSWLYGEDEEDVARGQ